VPCNKTKCQTWFAFSRSHKRRHHSSASSRFSWQQPPLLRFDFARCLARFDLSYTIIFCHQYCSCVLVAVLKTSWCLLEAESSEPKNIQNPLHEFETGKHILTVRKSDTLKISSDNTEQTSEDAWHYGLELIEKTAKGLLLFLTCTHEFMTGENCKFLPKINGYCQDEVVTSCGTEWHSLHT